MGKYSETIYLLTEINQDLASIASRMEVGDDRALLIQTIRNIDEVRDKITCHEFVIEIRKERDSR